VRTNACQQKTQTIWSGVPEVGAVGPLPDVGASESRRSATKRPLAER
jgi:hypothetical protein